MPRKSVKKSVNAKTNNNSIIRTRKKKFTRKSVLSMLSAMENPSVASGSTDVPTPTQQDLSPAESEFLQTGRTGRRNALPDILEANKAAVSSADLPAKMETLTTNDTKQDDPVASTSKS